MEQQSVIASCILTAIFLMLCSVFVRITRLKERHYNTVLKIAIEQKHD